MRFFTDFKNSFYNIPAYWEKMKRRPGKVFLHVILYSLIFSLVSTVLIGVKGHQLASTANDIYKNDIPYYEFKDGELSIYGDEIYSYDDESTFLYFDTSEYMDVSYTYDESLAKYDTYILVFKDGLIVNSNTRIQSFYFKDIGITNFSKNDVSDLDEILNRIKAILYVFVFIGIFIGLLITFGIGVIFYGVIGLIINSVVKSGYNFSELMRASAYILTVPLTLGLIISAVGLNIKTFWLHFFINVGYMAIILSKKSSYIKTHEEDQYDNNDSNLIEGE